MPVKCPGDTNEIMPKCKGIHISPAAGLADFAHFPCKQRRTNTKLKQNKTFETISTCYLNEYIFCTSRLK